MAYFITSSPSVSMDGAINPANGFLDRIKREIPIRSRCVFISSHPDDPHFGDHCTVCMAQAFEACGFEFEAFDCLDSRNAVKARDLIGRSDWIILGGGRVPLQNEFLHRIHLSTLLRRYKGCVMGISAGSMNMARVVYNLPEEPGDTDEKTFHRSLKGIGLTDVQMIPHYDLLRTMQVDGKHVFEDIAMPDSIKYGTRYYVFPDGTYLLGKNGEETIYGAFYVIENGIMRQVLEEGQSIKLPFI